MKKFKIQLISILKKNQQLIFKSKLKLLFSLIIIPCIILVLLIVLMYFSKLYSPDNKEVYCIGIGDLLGPKHKLLIGSEGGLNDFQRSIFDKLVLITWYDNNQNLNIESVRNWFIEYDNYTEANNRYTNKEEYIIGALWFEDNSQYGRDISYTLRFDPENLYDNTIQFKEFSKIVDRYLDDYFVKIQSAIDSAILYANGLDVYLMGIAQPIQIPSNYQFQVWAQPKYLFLKEIGGLFISLSIFASFYNLSTTILVEKEKEQFEIMKIMGLNNFTYHFANMITGLIFSLPIVLIITIVFKVLGFYHYLSMYWVFIILIVYSITLILFSQITILFFKKSSTFGFIFSLIIIILSGIGYFINHSTLNPTIKLFFSLISPIGITLFNYSTIIKDLNLIHFISSFSSINLNTIPNEMLIIVILGSNIYLYLTILYGLDKLISNDHFTLKSILKIIFRKFSKNSNNFQQLNSEMKIGNKKKLYFEDSDSDQDPTISISNLRKEYDNLTVLKDINLNLYPNNILALLGPNGCGKSTLFDILVGLKKSSGGEIIIKGLDIEFNKEKIRSDSILGICRQSNDLWDQLTVFETLKLYSGIKCSELLLTSINYLEIIKDLKFENKLNELVSNLSGGEKRKLSLAISFIGNSNTSIYFLDEPTSGIDLKSKRDIWRFLNKMKKDKTIIFTTHDLNEASIISDRIAIISNGKIKCEGSYLYLKKNFSDGYILSIDKDNEEKGHSNSDKLISTIINRNISGSKTIPNNSNINNTSQLNFILPLNQSNQFKSLLEELESQKEKLFIKSIGISISSFEELYLKICNRKDNSNNSSIINNNNSSILKSSNNNNNNNNIQQIISLLIKRYKTLRNGFKPLITTIIVSLLIIASGVMFYKTIPAIEYYQDSYEYSLDIHINGISNSSNKIPFTYISTHGNYSFNNYSFSYFGNNYSDPFSNYLVNFTKYSPKTIFISNETLYLDYITENYYKLSGSIEFLDYYVFNNYSRVFQYKVYYNNFYLHAIPMYLNFIHNLVSNFIGIKITTFSHPLPHSPSLIEKASMNTNIPSNIIFYVSIIAAFSFLAVSLSTNYLEERICGTTRLLIQNGLKNRNYWISNFIFDYCIIYSVFIIFASLIIPFEKDFRDQIVIFLISSILFIHSILPFSYLFSFKFKSSGKSIGIFFVLVYCVGFIITLVDFLFRALAYKQYDLNSEEKWDLIEKILYMISPLMCYAKLLAIITKFPGVQRVNLLFIKDYWSFNHCLSPMLALLVHSIILHLFIFNINNISSFKLRKIINRLKSVKSKHYTLLKQVIHQDDNEELEEEINPIIINNLNKVYKSNYNQRICNKGNQDVIAIKNLSLSILKGETFGVCGSIGSGKSTLINLLTNQMEATSGEIYVNGNLIDKEKRQELSLSVCEQFDDPLIGLLTAREIFKLFCRIKGIGNENDINEIVETFIRVMDLTLIADTMISTYSGGNKRKVSLSISCIGNPTILLLDEFTTSCDTITKRLMWDLISSIKKDKLILLTSHSVKECEYLCDRILILSNSNKSDISSSIFIGKTQSCKYYFGLYYSIDIFIKSNFKDRQEQIINIIKQNLPNQSKLIEHYNLYLNFEIPISFSSSPSSFTSSSTSSSSSNSTQTILLSTLFNIFENNLKQYINDYSINQSPSIEKSFLKLNN